MGLGIAIKLLVNQVSEDSGIKSEANIFGEEIRLDNKVEIALYRIIQEATNNILKYSKKLFAISADFICIVIISLPNTMIAVRFL